MFEDICLIMARAIVSSSSFWISGDVYFSSLFRSHSRIYESSWARRFSSWWKLEFYLVFSLGVPACRAKYLMLDRIESKIILFLLFSNTCSSANHPYRPITVAGAVTYLATASICESDDSCFWNPFFFSIAFFQLENPFFAKAGSALGEFSMPFWSAFK